METKNSIQALADAIRLLAVTSREVMSTEDVATYVGCAPDSVRRWAANGDIAYSRQGRGLWFKKADVDAYLLGNRKANNDEISLRAEAYLRRR